MAEMAKYDRQAMYPCVKCGSSETGHPHSISFVGKRKSYDNMGKVISREPEMVVVNCWRCGYEIGQFLPLDSE